MSRIATHYNAINRLDLRALASGAGDASAAATILASVYDDYRIGYYTEYKGTPSPFMQPKGGFSFWGILEKHSIYQYWRDTHLAHRAQGRSMRLTVFGDNSCLITFKQTSHKSNRPVLVPWPFRMPRTFEANGTRLLITAHNDGPQFDYMGGCAGSHSLFKPIDPKNEDLDPRSLRKSFQDRLRHEMSVIIDALSDDLPIATGSDWIQNGLDGTGVLPPCFTYAPTKSSGPDPAGIMNLLGPYLDARFPGMKKIRGQVTGRAVSPQGVIGKPEVEVTIDGDRDYALGWALTEFLDRKDCPVPMAKQIAQSLRGPQSICLVFTHRPGQSSAHEQIEALALFGPALQPTS